LKAKIETWRRFWRLSPDSRALVLKSAAALAATWLGLRIVGFRRWKRALLWLTPRTAGRVGATESASAEAARAIARMQQTAARHLFFRPNCLEQSLVFWWLLQRRGIPAELRIGARKAEGRFEAHAWVESEGVVLSDADEGHLHFVPFESSVISMETQTR
jgi:hypothetical protein